MRISRWTLTLAFALLPPSLLFAADTTGKWTGPMQGGGDVVFTLKSVNAAVTGTMLSIDGKEHPIMDGKLDGDNISFTVPTEWQGSPIKLIVKGKVAGEQMQLNIGTDDGNWNTDATVKREPKK
jgi:hypothetical protein